MSDERPATMQIEMPSTLVEYAAINYRITGEWRSIQIALGCASRVALAKRQGRQPDQRDIAFLEMLK